MSNVIDFLERMGQDARLCRASQSEVEVALANAQIDPELQMAILAGDPLKLELLLGQNNVCCAFFPGKDDEDEDTEESPSREGEEIASWSMSVASVG